MKEYKVIHGHGSEELTKLVTQAMEEGWQPIGGVHFAQIQFPDPLGKSTIWAQALVR